MLLKIGKDCKHSRGGMGVGWGDMGVIRGVEWEGPLRDG